jgi:hypothetical protein
MTTVGGLKKVSGVKDRTMELTTDEGKMLVGMLLDDLETINRFVVHLKALKTETSADSVLTYLAADTVLTLSLGKATIARMLIEKDESLRPNAEAMKLLEKWKPIEDAVIKAQANDS